MGFADRGSPACLPAHVPWPSLSRIREECHPAATPAVNSDARSWIESRDDTPRPVAMLCSSRAKGTKGTTAPKDKVAGVRPTVNQGLSPVPDPS